MAEVYNQKYNQWELVAAKMTHARFGLVTVCMGNMIYAIGK